MNKTLEDLTPDLLVTTLTFLEIEDVASMAINCAFRATSCCDPLWEQLCKIFWTTKHPIFHLTPERRKQILSGHSNKSETSSPPLATWKQRYQHSLKDGKRTHLKGPEELSALTFDFRFRAKPDHFLTRDFRFDLESGRVEGHPNGLSYHWTLNGGREVTLGLYPPARVRRLRDWGWALVNPNIVAVSISPEEGEEDGGTGDKEDDSAAATNSNSKVPSSESSTRSSSSSLRASRKQKRKYDASELVQKYPELFERSRTVSGAVRALMDMHPIAGFTLNHDNNNPARTANTDNGPGGDDGPLPMSFSGLGVYPQGEGAGGFGVPVVTRRESGTRPPLPPMGDSEEELESALLMGACGGSCLGRSPQHGPGHSGGGGDAQGKRTAGAIRGLDDGNEDLDLAVAGHGVFGGIPTRGGGGVGVGGGGGGVGGGGGGGGSGGGSSLSGVEARRDVASSLSADDTTGSESSCSASSASSGGGGACAGVLSNPAPAPPFGPRHMHQEKLLSDGNRSTSTSSCRGGPGEGGGYAGAAFRPSGGSSSLAANSQGEDDEMEALLMSGGASAGWSGNASTVLEVLAATEANEALAVAVAAEAAEALAVVETSEARQQQQAEVEATPRP